MLDNSLDTESLLLKKASDVSEIKGFSGDFRWLSNFYPMEPFVYEGIEYTTSENYYQAMKSIDRNERLHISTLEPAKAKRYASPNNKNFVEREDWSYIKLEVMEFILRRKFSQEKFKNLLLATRDIYIEETNGWGDVFWGCTPAGEGFNNLGLIIMKIRKELQEGKNLLDYKPVITKVLNDRKKSKPQL